MSEISGVLPWTKSCFVCGEQNPDGLRLRSRIEDGRVFIDYRTRERDVGYRHIVHGGIAMTLLDEVMTWAAIVKMEGMCVAAELTTRLRHPVEVGVLIRVEGWVLRSSKRICFTEGVILNESGGVLLSASGKYMPMPEEGLELCEKDFIVNSKAIHPSDIIRRHAKD